MKIILMVDIFRNIVSAVKCEVKVKVIIKVKSVYEPSGQSVRSSSHEATRSISTPPGWDASPSQGYPQQ